MSKGALHVSDNMKPTRTKLLLLRESTLYSALLLLLLFPSRSTQQDNSNPNIGETQSSWSADVAFNIWGAVKPGYGLANGWESSTPTLTDDFTCFGGISNMDKCTLAPSYRDSHDTSANNAAESYLADSGNWQSGTLYNAEEATEDGESTWCVSCCDNTRTEFTFNETFAMQCPRTTNEAGFLVWEEQLDAATNSGLGTGDSSSGNCQRFGGTGPTCDEMLSGNSAETCENLELSGYDCSNCVCGEDQGLGYAWWQFRFARLDTWNSDQVTTCDLQMTMNEAIEADGGWYGYSLTIVVVERSDDSGRYWRGVEKCHVVGIRVRTLPTSGPEKEWWDAIVDSNPSENGAQPCWMNGRGSAEGCFYQQITVTNELKWCDKHYAKTGNVAHIYESGFDSTPVYFEGNMAELISSPTFDELDGEQLIDGDSTYVFEVSSAYCGAGSIFLGYGILAFATIPKARSTHSILRNYALSHETYT